jgi:hypothetical protein
MFMFHAMKLDLYFYNMINVEKYSYKNIELMLLKSKSLIVNGLISYDIIGTLATECMKNVISSS